MGYDRQKSSRLAYNLFSQPKFNSFCLNLAQFPKNWLSSLVLRSASTSKNFWSQNSNEILNFLRKTVAFKVYWS